MPRLVYGWYVVNPLEVCGAIRKSLSQGAHRQIATHYFN
jgi:hypothetical protein